MKSNLDLVNECDVFPYPDRDPQTYADAIVKYYTLLWESVPIGYILESVFNELAKVPVKIRGEMEVNPTERTISIFHLPTEEARSETVAATVQYWRSNKTFEVLSGWRNELYPVYGPGNTLLYKIERCASPLFGFVTYGVHMTAFVRDPASNGIKIWVARRSQTKSTWPGMLDNTSAGGMASGEDHLSCVVRESEEEASLPPEIVRNRATTHGTLTYLYVRGAKAGGEIGLVQPEVQYVYELDLPMDVIPTIHREVHSEAHREVQEFYLWTVEEVKEHLARGEFKPNCALLILDFFIRHRILTAANEKNFEEIKRRLHRDLEFPGPHRI
ncbi:hypothetical protein B7494_g6226 [Chlorociboria aeruginascens]|nr:hypothetical protein B7494_g6226 [Chlorociboria aeruginascens]